GLPWAELDLGPAQESDGRLALPLDLGPHGAGSLAVPSTLDPPTRERLRERVVPALEALLSAALARDALEVEAIEARALRRSDVVKTAVLRSVSHDLRSPLTAIITAAEALGSPALRAHERDELAEGLVAEAQRLEGVVDKLLDLSRLQGGQAEPRADWSSLEEVLASAAESSGLSHDRLRLQLDPELPLIRADGAQLERAFANLLENARRFAGDHPVLVRARAYGDRLVVRVIDRGPGIPHARLRHLFEPFWRAPGENGGGSGLGLAIVRGFVEANGGRVWAESLPGQGSTFVVELPLEGRPAVAR
ncbi:MAG: ATP-binding protein, partial [Actinomycetota bacterium]|nr:ATP-binding protein [Actinomycetota bacterium]